eukprot:1326476-Prymnesium_polylepis.1
MYSPHNASRGTHTLSRASLQSCAAYDTVDRRSGAPALQTYRPGAPCKRAISSRSRLRDHHRGGKVVARRREGANGGEEEQEGAVARRSEKERQREEREGAAARRSGGETESGNEAG